MSEFYAIDSCRVTLREYWWGTKSPLVLLIGGILKCLRVRIPSSSDDPNVDSLLPFQVQELPAEIAARFGPLAADLAALGFSDPVFHVIYDPGTRTTIYWSALRHSSGQHFARIHHRVWQQAQKSDRGLFAMYLTAFTDGTFFVSSAGKPDMAAPETVRMNRMRGATPAVLWAAHNRMLGSISERKLIAPVNSQADLVEASERHHALLRDFHLARGVFRLRTESERAKAETFTASVAEATAGGLENPEVLAELERLQTQKPGWQAGFWVLAASLVGFVAAGASRWDWKFTLWIIPILLFHETGHWVAMRLFDYKNLRMFFIPFFGAAVTGRNWNVAGWKKALVSLAGPVPGIALGIVLGLLGLVLHRPRITDGALLLLFVNGFNLLPILPLDGGHVLQDTLFCRNRWLDGAFRIVAIFGLLALGIFGGMKLLMYVAIPLGIALPLVFKLGKVTDQLRLQHLPEPAPGEDRIPPPTAQAIIQALRGAFSPKVTLGHKALAQHTLSVFERLNAKPPGVLATLSLLAVHGGALLASLVIGALLLVGQHGSDFLAAAARRSQHPFQPGDIQAWPDRVVANEPATVRNLLILTLKNRAAAGTAFATLTNRVTAGTSLVRLGDTLLCSLPADDDAAREQWFDLLQTRSTNIFVVLSNAPVSVSLSFVAPNRTGATNIEQELQQYFQENIGMRLVAPWSPAAKQPKFSGWRRARQDWMRLSEAQARAAQDPALEDYFVKINAASKRGATAEQQRLVQEQAARLQSLKSEAFDRLRAKANDSIDPALIELSLRLNSDSLTNNAEREATVRQIAAKLGEVDHPPNDPLGLSTGFVLRRGLFLQMPSASFYDVRQGLPALTDWLQDQGCRRIRYAFEGTGWQGLLDELEK